MHSSLRGVALAVFIFFLACDSTVLFAQTSGTSGTITGVVTDTTDAVIPGATVTIHNPVSGFSRTATSDGAGNYQFKNVPFNPYHLTVEAAGFASRAQDVDVRSPVPVSVKTALDIGVAATTVTVESGGDLVETDSTLHTDVDRGLIDKLPLESQSSALSSLVTLSSPGVAADSNGLFHGMGDHASNTFSVDGQQISDQQSKVFSNQLPSNSVQSMEVIAGAPPAEFGGKTSLVIEVTTRSGLGQAKPTGSVSTSYGSFGSATAAADLSYGGKNWGNFVEVDGLNTGRFLDPAEFAVFHDKGNELNTFDRIDRQFTDIDSVHLNLNFSRSWFQNPNSYDNLNIHDQFGNPVGNTDQRSQIVTYDISPTYTRTIGTNSLFNLGAYIRKDQYNYYPSGNPLADLGPLQSQTIAQDRSLANAGVHTDFSYTHGNNNIKAGAVYQQTFLRERDNLGIVNATFNSPCLDASGAPLIGFTSTSQCSGNDKANPSFLPVLLPYDLTRSGTLYDYYGHTDVKEIALYVQDQIKTGNWLFNLGIRGDIYNGLAKASQAEPRLGAAYTVKPTSTVLRVSYARTLETPFNENLVLSSNGCLNAVLSPLLLCNPGVSGTLQPGFRNEFHAGLQQAFGKYLVVGGDYIWKYTHNAFDFSILGNTPITFPIDWHNSKIPGLAVRADVPNFHNVSGFVVLSSVSARFFPPQSAGAGATVGKGGFPFRIDHDEKLDETTHVQYQIPGKRAPWFGINWRYDSGLVASATPCYNNTDPNSSCAGISTTLNGQPAVNLSGFTADEEFQAGLACGGVKAAPGMPLPSTCLASQLTSSLLQIPAPGTEDDDRNPSRIKSRNLFDASVGDDNLLGGERYKWSLRLTGVNLGDKKGLYNFLSTFSGTHYVTPRALTAELGFHF